MQKKFSIILLALSLIPLLLLSKISCDLLTDSIYTRTGSRLELLAKTTIDKIDTMIALRRKDLQRWGESPIVKNARNDEAIKKLTLQLKEWKKNSSVYSAIFFVDSTGKIVASTKDGLPGREVTNEVWYKTALKATETYKNQSFVTAQKTSSVFVSDLEYDSLTRSYAINFSTLVFDDDSKQPIGLLTSRFNWSELFNATNSVIVNPQEIQHTQSSNSYVLLINREGNVISGPGSLIVNSSPEEMIFKTNLLKQAIPSAQESIQGKQGFLVEANTSGDSFLTGYAHSSGYSDFKGLGWSVIVSMNYAQVLAPVNTLRHIFEIFICGFGILSLLIALQLANKILQPIAQLNQALKNLAGGQFTTQVSLPSSDELTTLGEVFNQTVIKLGTLAYSLEKSKEDAEKSNNAKGAFISHIGYKLRSGLNSAIDLTDTILESNLSTEQQSTVKSIRRSATSMFSFVNDLLNIQKLEEDRNLIQHNSFNLKETLTDVIEVAALTAQQKDLNVSLLYPTNVPRNFIGDCPRIHQIAANLLSYAIKFSLLDELLVLVRAKELDDGHFIIWITISANNELLDKGKFNQLIHLIPSSTNNSTTSIDETSVELAIYRKHAELLGGSLGVYTELESGQVYWLSLSLPPDSEQNSTIKETTNSKFNKLNILVASDGILSGHALEEELKGLGIKNCARVTTADALTSLLEAQAKSNPCDIIFVDKVLSSEDSHKLLNEIKLNPALTKTKVILISNLLSKSVDTDLGASVKVVTRPLREEDLSNILRATDQEDPATETPDNNPLNS